MKIISKFRYNMDMYKINRQHDNARFEFTNVTGLDFEILSTIDHPYVSLPARLIDGHALLFSKCTNSKVCILNWDVSQPNDRTYRYDMQIDLAIIGRIRCHFFFEDSVPYALQKSKAVNYSDYETIFNNVIDFLIKNGTIHELTAKNIHENYLKLKKTVIRSILNNDGSLAQDYTKKSIVAINRLLRRPEIADFVENNYLYYYNSVLMTKWIPYCIINTNGKKAIDQLASSGVFGRKIFRTTEGVLQDDLLNKPSYIQKHKVKICKQIQAGSVIPSIELLYWSLELAGKYHFGNDYGFFDRYAKYLGKKELSNQLTKTGQDGKAPLELDKDYGVIYNIESGKISNKSNSAEVKHTRVNSLFAFYILLGDSMSSILNSSNFENSKTISISSGDISVT